jgi:hypothetical protein
MKQAPKVKVVEPQIHNFEYMVTYLEHPEVPRCGQSETLINVWRQMESVRTGFKSHQGRLNHLKLFQVTFYLNRKEKIKV